MSLRDEHLTELHRRARELEVPRYRMLPRDQLIEAIAERQGEEAPQGAGREEAVEAGLQRPRHEPEPQPQPKAEAERDSEERQDEAGDGDGRAEETEAEADVETEAVTGVLDRMAQGYGFLRLS